MNAEKTKRTLLIILLFLLILVSDQLSKVWAVDVLAGSPPRTYLGVLQLTYAENSGGWGSLGANWSPALRKFCLIIAPGIVLLFLGAYAIKKETFTWPKSVGYASLIAGGLGNLIDRFRLDYVIDFLYLGYGPIGTNIFNIADMAILLGFFLLLLSAFKEPKEKAEQDITPS